MLHQIQIEFHNPEDARELLSLAEQYDDITAIEEKSFTGDVTTIELYVSVAINVLTIVGAAVNALIAKKKVSSVKIDGDNYVGNGLCAVPLLSAAKTKRNRTLMCTGKEKAKRKAPAFAGACVGITYFHGPSPGNYRRRK